MKEKKTLQVSFHSHPGTERVKKRFIHAILSFIFLLGLLPLPSLYSKASNNQLPTQNLRYSPSGDYTFTLSPDIDGKRESQDMYSRESIESFLCTFALNYIEIEDTYRVPGENIYKAKRKKITQAQKQYAENCEIRKWFEDKVTVTSRGNVNMMDEKLIRRFFTEVNEIIGGPNFIKFDYTPGLPAANIVIEIDPPGQTGKSKNFAGETSLLEDNMGVSLTMINTMNEIKTFNLGTGKISGHLDHIQFSPEEIEFRKNNRFVKAKITNLIDPLIRHTTLVHEMLHTLGFPSHSPYNESNLFPTAVIPESISLSRPVITPLASEMIRMLYRPEILAGMTVKEAGTVLSRLKRTEKTTPADTIAFLKEKDKTLNTLKSSSLEKEKKNSDLRTALYLKLDTAMQKQKAVLDELVQMIPEENSLHIALLKHLKRFEVTEGLVDKLILIQRDIILLKDLKKKELSHTQRKWTDKVIGSLERLLRASYELSQVEREIEMAQIERIKNETELSIRRILRQQTCIAQALPVLEKTK